MLVQGIHNFAQNLAVAYKVALNNVFLVRKGSIALIEILNFLVGEYLPIYLKQLRT